jgi:predicted nucleotidyltransferase
LYGSFARHEETEGSDVDVLVVLEGMVSQVDEIRRMGDSSTDLLLKYNELISIVPMSQNNFLHSASPLLRNIRREGILV